VAPKAAKKQKKQNLSKGKANVPNKNKPMDFSKEIGKEVTFSDGEQWVRVMVLPNDEVRIVNLRLRKSNPLVKRKSTQTVENCLLAAFQAFDPDQRRIIAAGAVVHEGSSDEEEGEAELPIVVRSRPPPPPSSSSSSSSKKAGKGARKAEKVPSIVEKASNEKKTFDEHKWAQKTVIGLGGKFPRGMSGEIKKIDDCDLTYDTYLKCERAWVLNNTVSLFEDGLPQENVVSGALYPSWVGQAMPGNGKGRAASPNWNAAGEVDLQVAPPQLPNIRKGFFEEKDMFVPAATALKKFDTVKQSAVHCIDTLMSKLSPFMEGMTRNEVLQMEMHANNSISYINKL